MSTSVTYSLGSSNRQVEEFIEILRTYRIASLVDVRRFPTSRFEHFKRENLTETLRKNGIEYHYLGKELGGYRKVGYDEHTVTEDFQRGRDELETIAKRYPTVIMCAERLPWRCHRRILGDHLRRRGWRVIHIIERDRVWEPLEI